MHSDVQPDRMIGAVLEGAYQITGHLGEGGMGWVYEARHLRLNKRVAVKLMARELAANPEALARFHREAEVTSQLGHPHLVNVLDFGTTQGGKPYLVMEYLDGEDLERRIQRARRLPLEAVVSITRQVASALGAAHAEGIVHRDLKPANVFLLKVPDEADFVKVLDFGISKIKAGQTKLTRATAVIGTPEYMSPEQANGLVDDIDHRVDQWALACIAWEMLSGHSPFVADDIGAVFYRIINTDPHPLSARAPEVPSAVETVLRRALSKQAADRYPSIKEFARAFESAAMGKLAEATPAPVLVADVAPTAAATATGKKRVTLGYGDPPEPVPAAAHPALAHRADTSGTASPAGASTFEARVLSLREVDAIEDDVLAGLATRRYKAAAVVGVAAGALLAASVIALRPRKAEVTAPAPAQELRVLPVVRTLPEPAAAPAPDPAPAPVAHVERKAAEVAASASPHPSAEKTRSPAVAPESLKKPPTAPRTSDRSLPDPDDPFVAPAESQGADPFQPDQPAAKKSAARQPDYADPFEPETTAAKPPAAARAPNYASPFESDELRPTVPR